MSGAGGGVVDGTGRGAGARRRSAGRRGAREDGSVAIELALGVGLLLLPVALLVLLLPTWLERQSMARVAAQEAARTAVVVADDSTAAVAARAVVADVARNHGVDPGDVSVRFSGGLQRGQTLTAEVSVRIPATVFPGLTEVAAFTWRTSHSEHVDRYRSVP